MNFLSTSLILYIIMIWHIQFLFLYWRFATKRSMQKGLTVWKRTVWNDFNVKNDRLLHILRNNFCWLTLAIVFSYYEQTSTPPILLHVVDILFDISGSSKYFDIWTIANPRACWFWGYFSYFHFFFCSLTLDIFDFILYANTSYCIT